MKHGSSQPSNTTEPKVDPFHFGSLVDPKAQARVEAMQKRRAEKRKAALANTLAKMNEDTKCG